MNLKSGYNNRKKDPELIDSCFIWWFGWILKIDNIVGLDGFEKLTIL